MCGASWWHLQQSTTYGYNTRHQKVNSKLLFQSLTLETMFPLLHGEQTVPSGSCCASAALGRAPPVYCEPVLPGCARSAAGPSPSSLGSTSSAKPSAASDHSDAPPTAKKQQHRNIRKYNKIHTTIAYFLLPVIITSSACFLMMASSFCSGLLSLFKLCISSMASFPEQPQRIAHKLNITCQSSQV